MEQGVSEKQGAACTRQNVCESGKQNLFNSIFMRYYRALNHVNVKMQIQSMSNIDLTMFHCQTGFNKLALQ